MINGLSCHAPASHQEQEALESGHKPQCTFQERKQQADGYHVVWFTCLNLGALFASWKYDAVAGFAWRVVQRYGYLSVLKYYSVRFEPFAWYYPGQMRVSVCWDPFWACGHFQVVTAIASTSFWRIVLISCSSLSLTDTMPISCAELHES
jgi:hypothetical protein